MSPPNFLSRMLLAHDQVKLGDLVLSKDAPWNDYRSYPRALQPNVDYSRTTLRLTEVLANVFGGELKGNVGDMFNAARTANQSSFQALQAMESECVRLKNSGDKFENIFLGNDMRGVTGQGGAAGESRSQETDGNVRRWLEKQMIGRNSQAYLVVGIHTIPDAQITRIQSMGRASGVQVATPDPIPIGLRVGVAQHVFLGNTTIARGNQIYALEYRQVRLKGRIFKGVRRPRVEDAYLSKKNVWKVFGADDGQRVDLEDEEGNEVPDVNRTERAEESEEEYLEADLVDDLGPIEIEYEDIEDDLGDELEDQMS
jgi:hypothetical protein